MCGLVGYWDFSAKQTSATLTEHITNMANTLLDRGPDQSGHWTEARLGLALGHRRLAIRDVSIDGRQPMLSASQRYVMVYNGEVYNTDALRPELSQAGYVFRGHSDTEVILASIELKGLEATLQACIGMFALALFDRQESRLFLVRDRMGIKPLYFGIQHQQLFFASQPKACLAHPGFISKINRDVLSSYFYLNYIPTPHSIYEGMHKLKPGTIVSIDAKQQITEKVYWDLETIAHAGLENPTSWDTQAAISALESRLKDAIRLRMIADVPLGAFLSGGIDSSLVVALMQAESPRPIQTFSIGFQESAYNEAVHAKAIAQHLGTAHEEQYLSPQAAIDIIPKIPQWYDEPFADVSQIPTYLVSRLAKRSVTVSLSGDGGDELFAGYHRYHLGYQIWRWMRYLPFPLRKIAALVLKSIPIRAYEAVQGFSGGCLPRLLGERCHRLADIMSMKTAQAFYQSLIAIWPKPETILCGGSGLALEGFQTRLQNLWDKTLSKSKDAKGMVEAMQLTDSLHYLPDDILSKVDRASMAVSLEARVPLLDHRLVEWAFALPQDLKIRYGQSKWLLRQVLYRYVPPHLVDRPKMGFGVPIDTWLRGPLRDWAEDLLSVSALKQSGFLNPSPIRARWQSHLKQERNYQYALWSVLMFQAWYRHYHG